MIAFIRGKIESKDEKSVVVMTAGLGYQIFCSVKTLEEIKAGEEVKLFTYLCLKKETIELYGFFTLKELELFKTLNSISGIGVKTALNLTSFGSLENLKKIIESQKFQPELKGIGKKRLQKIILEISNRLVVGESKEIENNLRQNSVFEALVSLGFSSQRVKEALKQLPPEIKETEQKIKECLKLLQGN